MDQLESSSNNSADERTFLLNNELATVTNEVELVPTKRGTGGKFTWLYHVNNLCDIYCIMFVIFKETSYFLYPYQQKNKFV